MKKFTYLILVLVAVVTYTSCEKYETYGDKKAKERDAIDNFISKNNIQVIDENQFEAQGYTTDTAQNQYVLMSRTGVYMQIVRKGCGDKLEENKSVGIICRFTEYNILEDSVLLSNLLPAFYIYNNSTGQTIDASQYYEKMTVSRTGTTITAAFVSGLMKLYHSSSSSVPGGWLIPLNYINIGRPESENDEIARVNLIVPHSQGTADASSSVYPCHYEITYVRTK
jgi:hypothetical protein